MMTEDNQVLIQFVEDFREKFSKMPFEEIAFPRGCNNLAKYSNDDLVYSKGTPIHVKGALWYNRLIKKKNLAKRYPYISEGEKVKFCYLMRNKYGITVISSPAELPKELDIEQFIDYDTQFNKAFIEPLNAIAEKINWTTKQNTATTLDDFFS
jgi:hypothetical protein